MTIVASPAVQIKLCTEYIIIQVALITGEVKALKADDSIFGPQIHVHPQIHAHSSFMHSLKFGERVLAVSRRYPRMVVFEKCVGHL